MPEPFHHQVRVYLDEPEAARARGGEIPERLATCLQAHEATMISQLDAFEAYLAEVERAGGEPGPLYRWTKATVADPAMRAKHGTSFAIRVRNAEVYDKTAADALAADLQPLVAAGIVLRITRHDTNPATNIPIPREYA